MEMDNKPSSADAPNGAGVEDVNSGNDSQANDAGQSQDPLAIIKNITGREFKSVEDFTKHYKNLNSLVGTNPKEIKEKAAAYDELIKEADRIITEDSAPGSPVERDPNRRIDLLELKAENPIALKYLDQIDAVSKGKGLSLKEAFESMRGLIEAKESQEQMKEREQSPFVESKGRMFQDKSSKVSELASRILKTDSEADKNALVKEMFFTDKE